MDTDDYNALVLKWFRCIICHEFMHPPIRICILGHTFCKDCDKRMKKCPECESEKGSGRNYAVESMYNDLEWSCKQTRFGCDFKGLGRDVVKHTEQSCAYSTFSECPLSMYRCQWSGSTTDIMEHCEKYHSIKIYSKRKVIVRQSVWFKNNICFNCDLFKVYDKLFKYVSIIEKPSYCMRIFVSFLGLEEEAKNYNIYCKFKNDNYVRGPWDPKYLRFVFKEDSILIYQVALKKVSFEQALVHSISIIKNNEESHDVFISLSRKDNDQNST